MTRTNKIVLTNAVLSTNAIIYAWVGNPDLQSTLRLLAALTALCRELAQAACEQGRRQGHELKDYDSVIGSAMMLAAISNSVSNIDSSMEFEEHHLLGIVKPARKKFAPLDPSQTALRLLQALSTLNTGVINSGASNSHMTFVDLLGSLYTFADAAYEMAEEANLHVKTYDIRARAVDELVNATQHFRNNCNPR